ncbi:unnamed protein product [Brachionus calyciflorus]|uniref:Coiled-coil domain-containing protein 25 n=1 Tax=Brachionus calyciflorus TaxID=104777 RepID=A0A813UNK7_9BILA|nr:unnamed protein product [Brachionus calyciflorus]
MVLYFTSNVVTPAYDIYMGEDKYENEELLKYAWPEDIWFHVSKLSSAHVYLRLAKGQTIEDIPSAVLEDCVQLVKANSIEGNKINNVEIVYTPVNNLKKTAGMDVGQVGFHKDRDVKKTRVEKRINEIVNRLNKTKIEKKPDLKAEREERDRAEREDKKRLLREQKEREREEEKQKAQMAEQRSYGNLMSEEKMKSNKDGYDSDDFI